MSNEFEDTCIKAFCVTLVVALIIMISWAFLAESHAEGNARPGSYTGDDYLVLTDQAHLRLLCVPVGQGSVWVVTKYDGDASMMSNDSGCPPRRFHDGLGDE